MKKTLLIVIPLLALSGCASDYNRYAEAQIAMQTARSNAEAERYRAMAEIAKGGDTTARVAAMMALQGQGQPSQPATLFAPKSASDTIREWLGIILPTVVQGYGIHANQIIATTQSNNSRDVSVSTNSAFVGIAGEIQAPAANVTTTTTTDSHNTDSHAISDSYNPVDNSNQGNPALTCTTGPC